MLKNVEARGLLMNSLNLFFSYGHDESTQELISEIKEYFYKKGHEIFIDSDCIRAAMDWRRVLVEALDSTDTVLAFLSQRAIGKKDGVCLDELRISVTVPGVEVVSILLEEESTLEIPSTISRHQYVDMSDWREYINTSQWENYFDGKMEELAEFLESDKHFELQAEINLLKNFLLPDISDNKYYSLLFTEQIGRGQASEEFDTWLSSEKTPLFIIGKPGSGKSHFVAHKSYYNPDVLALYFFEFDKLNGNDIKSCIRSLCFQIASRLPDFRHWIMKEYNAHFNNEQIKNHMWFDENTERELYSKLIAVPARKTIDGKLGKKCLVIDAIDELPNEKMNQIIHLMIFDAELKLPKWVKCVFSCRSKEKIANILNGCTILEMDSAERKSDIVEYLQHRLGDEVSAEDIEKIAQKSECMFIYAEKFCDAYESGFIPIDEIPAGISNLYYVYFSKIFCARDYNSYILPLTIIACDTDDVLTGEIFLKVLNWKDTQLISFLETMKSFVTTSSSKKDKPQFCHKSMAEWITKKEHSKNFFVDIKQGREFMCTYAEREVENEVLDYSTMKFIYIQLTRYGNKQQRDSIKSNYKFMYELMYQAHLNADISLFNEIYRTIEDIVEYGFDTTANAKKYFCKAYFLKCQFEYVKGNVHEARKGIEVGMDLYKDYLSKDAELEISVKENYIWTIKDEQPENAKTMIDNLLEEVQKTECREKAKILSNLFFLRGVILYKMRNCGESFLNDALEALNRAKHIAKTFLESPTNHLLRIENQIGWVYHRMGRYDEAIEYYHNSLKMRIEKYGKFSYYTALGYDALARGYLAKAQKAGSSLSDEVMGYAKEALKINIVIFGEKSRHCARNLHTLAMICEANGKINEALELTKEAEEIYQKARDAEGSKIMREYIEKLSELC